jgi:predicted transcriptional regulator
VKGKRTLYEIYWEILTYSRNPKSFTSIIHRCNLNSKIGQQHIGFLEDKGYLERIDEQGRNLLRTTPAANPFLDAFKQMYLELFNEKPDFKL